MEFKTFRMSLADKRYAPMPKSALNELALAKKDTEKIAISCQRLIIRAMSKLIRFDATSDADLFQYFSAGNEAIMYSIETYRHDKIDFAYYCYMNIRNHIITYRKAEEPIIKKRMIKGEIQFAEYLHVDGLEKNPLELIIDEPSSEIEFDLEYIFKELSKGKNPIKEKSWNIFKCYYGLEDGVPKSGVETARIFEMTSENVNQSVRRVHKFIAANEEILKYFKNIFQNQ